MGAPIGKPGKHAEIERNILQGARGEIVPTMEGAFRVATIGGEIVSSGIFRTMPNLVREDLEAKMG